MDKRNILPGLLFAILAFTGCSVTALAVMAMGGSMGSGFLMGTFFDTEYFVVISGVIGAIVVFLTVTALLWYRTRRG